MSKELIPALYKNVFICIYLQKYYLYYLCRNVFLTQFADKENLDETGILEIDLAKVALYDEATKKQRLTKLDELEMKGWYFNFSKDIL